MFTLFNFFIRKKKKSCCVLVWNNLQNYSLVNSTEFLQSLSAGCILAVCVCLLSLSLSPGQPAEATPDISTLSFENWAALFLLTMMTALGDSPCIWLKWHGKLDRLQSDGLKTHITAYASPRHSIHDDVTRIFLQHMIQKPSVSAAAVEFESDFPQIHSHPLFFTFSKGWFNPLRC